MKNIILFNKNFVVIFGSARNTIIPESTNTTPANIISIFTMYVCVFILFIRNYLDFNMRKKIIFNIEKISDFKYKLLEYLKSYKNIAFLDSNEFNCKESYNFLNGKSDLLVGFGKISEYKINDNKNFEKFKAYTDKTKDWLFGYFGYDLKNETEDLKSNNFDGINFPNIYFFQPKYVLSVIDDIVEFYYVSEADSEQSVTNIYNEIISLNLKKNCFKQDIKISQKVNKKNYLQNINKLKSHIKKGDIYEVNYCMEFFSDSAVIEPYDIYKELNKLSPTPFSVFFRYNDKYLLSASPERFMQKQGTKIISQPIKGTIKRGKTADEDNFLKSKLEHDPKERAENIMIADLVRNDLSRTAEKASVKVEELCGVYGFEQVFQMISTISSRLSTKYHFVDAIKQAFPPGSMTGAPKIRAMQIIEDYENTKRGLYSGTFGYITPDNDFDFNVVIRSILYNSTNKYLSFSVGGAITDKSVPEKEYDECMLKAKAMQLVFSL